MARKRAVSYGVLRVTTVLLSILFLAGIPASAVAQTTPASVRLAAPADCLKNPGCGVGLKTSYGFDIASVFTPLASADAGVPALDDSVAEVAVVFSSSPDLSRPDVVSLQDDKSMIGDDHIFANVRTTTLKKYGRKLSSPLGSINKVLTTFQLRGLNQQVADGRLAEVVGAEFAESNGISTSGRTIPGKALVIGYVDTDESQILAHMYGATLRGAGFKVKVQSAGGLRPEAYAKFKKGKFDLLPGYTRSLASFLADKVVRGAEANVQRVLKRELRKIGGTPLKASPATDNNVFAMKRDLSTSLGITKLSDLSRYWPKSS